MTLSYFFFTETVGETIPLFRRTNCFQEIRNSLQILAIKLCTANSSSWSGIEASSSQATQKNDGGVVQLLAGLPHMIYSFNVMSIVMHVMPSKRKK